MTDKEQRNFYNGLIDLFQWVYEDPSRVNKAIKQIFDEVKRFESNAHDDGYDYGYEKGYDEGFEDGANVK